MKRQPKDTRAKSATATAKRRGIHDLTRDDLAPFEGFVGLTEHEKKVLTEKRGQFDGVRRRVTEELLGWSSPAGVSQSIARASTRKGRPRKDEERRLVLTKQKAGRSWKEIAVEMNVITGQEKSADAYRKLLSRK